MCNDEELGRDEVELTIPIPFPRALKFPKSFIDHSEIIEQLKQLKVNLPLLHLIKTIPIYTKVINDLCTLKRKHKVSKKTFITE